MATAPGTVDYILDQLSSITSVRARKMFGDYALYVNEKVVAFICDDQLFVKITKLGRELLGKDYQEGFAYKGAKASILIPEEVLDDRDRLQQIILTTEQSLPITKPKKKKI